jgi:F-type H+-transporting ATPase subunit gamma
MTQLKEIRSRIASIKNTRQVTSAMKMVSAAKLKKAQDIILQIALYDQKTYEILHHLMKGGSKWFERFMDTNDAERVLVVVVGSNRGLCGGFNSNVAKMAIQHVLNKYPSQLENGNVSFLVLGHQAEKELVNRGAIIFETAHQLIDHCSLAASNRMANQLIEWYITKKFQRIDFVFNKFKNAAVQLLTAERFLPLPEPEYQDEYRSRPFYIFEPTEEVLVKTIVPKALRLHLYKVLLDSNAAEHGARMTAMYQATENASDMLKELKNQYNNARQSSITNEIMEIISGAEALKTR